MIDSLVQLQISASPKEGEALPPGFEAFKLRFDHEKLMWEVNFTIEHFYQLYLKRAISDADLKILVNGLRRDLPILADQPTVLAHRDFHSRNIMVAPGKARDEGAAGATTERLVMIDFQDARLGPAQYDLVSLLRDSYYQLEEQQIARLIDYYIARYEAQSGKRIDRGEFCERLRHDGGPAQLQGDRKFRVFSESPRKRDLSEVHRKHLREHPPDAAASTRSTRRFARCCSITTISDHDLDQAMLMAAGLGTRLRPFTELVPKALLPVMGVPMAQFAVDALVAAGIHEDRSQRPSSPVAARAGLALDLISAGPGSRSATRARSFSEARGACGTRATHFGGRRVLLLNADVLSGADLPALIRRHDGAARALRREPHALRAPALPGRRRVSRDRFRRRRD